MSLAILSSLLVVLVLTAPIGVYEYHKNYKRDSNGVQTRSTTVNLLGADPIPVHIPMVAMVSSASYQVPYWLGGFAVTTPSPAVWTLPLTYTNGGKVQPGEFLQIRNYGPGSVTLATTDTETIESGPNYVVPAGASVSVLSNTPNWVVSQLTSSNASQPLTDLGSGDGTYITGTGASRTVNTYFKNVGDYGAKCDGITDDTVSIQNAINACTNIAVGSSCTVHFPSGKCVVKNLYIAGHVKLQGQGPYNSIIVPSTASGIDLGYLIADMSWLNGTVAIGAPYQISGMSFYGGNTRNYTFVCRAAVAEFYDSFFYGGVIANLLISSQTRNGTNGTAYMGSGEIVSCVFGQAAGFTTIAQYDIQIIDPLETINDWFLSECFLSGSSVLGTTYNMNFVPGGWLVSGNHFWGASHGSYNLKVSCYNTQVENNFFEEGVIVIGDSTTPCNTITIVGITIGPGNTFSSLRGASLYAGFGSATHIISTGNYFQQNANLTHGGTQTAQVLYSTNDFFYNAGAVPIYFATPGTAARVRVTNSYNTAYGQLLNYVTSGASLTTPSFSTLNQYNSLQHVVPWIVRNTIAGGDSFSLNILVPLMPVADVSYSVSLDIAAAAGWVGSVGIAYHHDALILCKNSTTFNVIITNEVIKTGSFTVAPAYVVSAIAPSALSITVSATFANVSSLNALGGAVLTVT